MVRGISRSLILESRRLTMTKVGAARYREMKERGDTPFPAQTVLERGKALMIPSRDPDRYIPCRVMVPEDGKQVKAVFMHIHGGGWVIGSEDG